MNITKIINLIKSRKELTIIALFAVLAFEVIAFGSIIACGNALAEIETEAKTEYETEDEMSAQLSETYDFYDDSIEILKTNMKLDTAKCNAVFEALLEAGLDEEITYCFNKNDYYKVRWGLASVDVYLSNNGTVDKIMDRNTQLYPKIEPSAEIITTEITTEEAYTETIAETSTETVTTVTAEIVTEAPQVEAHPVEEVPVAEAPPAEAHVEAPPAEAPAAVSVIVYITDTGEKYHRSDCRYLKNSKIEISLEDAVNRGYEPCKVCKPPTQ